MVGQLIAERGGGAVVGPLIAERGGVLGPLIAERGGGPDREKGGEGYGGGGEERL